MPRPPHPEAAPETASEMSPDFHSAVGHRTPPPGSPHTKGRESISGKRWPRCGGKDMESGTAGLLAPHRSPALVFLCGCVLCAGLLGPLEKTEAGRKPAVLGADHWGQGQSPSHIRSVWLWPGVQASLSPQDLCCEWSETLPHLRERWRGCVCPAQGCNTRLPTCVLLSLPIPRHTGSARCVTSFLGTYAQACGREGMAPAFDTDADSWTGLHGDQWLYLFRPQTPPSLHPMSVSRLTSESCTRTESGGAEGTDQTLFFSRLSSGVLLRPALSRHGGSGLPWPSVRDGDTSPVSLWLCYVLKQLLSGDCKVSL